MNALTDYEAKCLQTLHDAALRRKLVPRHVRVALPPLRSTEGKADPLAVAKFFTPDGRFTWYALEFDGKDTFFGLVDGQARELGYFSLHELENVRGPLGLAVERDIAFAPTPLSALP